MPANAVFKGLVLRIGALTQAEEVRPMLRGVDAAMNAIELALLMFRREIVLHIGKRPNIF